MNLPTNSFIIVLRQEKPKDFLMMGMGETIKTSTSESFIATATSSATGGGDVVTGPPRRVCSESLDMPLSESPTHSFCGHKRNPSNGSTVYHSRNPSGEIR